MTNHNDTPTTDAKLFAGDPDTAERCAGFGLAALQAGAPDFGLHQASGEAQWGLVDVFTNLMHWGDANGHDWADAFAVARTAYDQEIGEWADRAEHAAREAARCEECGELVDVDEDHDEDCSHHPGPGEPCPVCDAQGEHQSCSDADGKLIDDHPER